MFELFKKKKYAILAPLSGEILPLSETGDLTFSDELVGKGIAIKPIDGKLYAPVNGVLQQVFSSKHAYIFVSDEGVEVLVHCGIDTVELKGAGFTTFRKTGDRVAIGDLVAEMDLVAIEQSNKKIITPVIITNHDDYTMQVTTSARAVANQTEIITLQVRS